MDLLGRGLLLLERPHRPGAYQFLPDEALAALINCAGSQSKDPLCAVRRSQRTSGKEDSLASYRTSLEIT